MAKNVIVRGANEHVIVLEINEEILSKTTKNGYVFDSVMEELNTFVDCIVASEHTRLHLIEAVVEGQCVRQFIVSLDVTLNVTDYQNLIQNLCKICEK